MVHNGDCLVPYSTNSKSDSSPDAFLSSLWIKISQDKSILDVVSFCQSTSAASFLTLLSGGACFKY